MESDINKRKEELDKILKTIRIFPKSQHRDFIIEVMFDELKELEDPKDIANAAKTKINMILDEYIKKYNTKEDNQKEEIIIEENKTEVKENEIEIEKNESDEKLKSNNELKTYEEKILELENDIKDLDESDSLIIDIEIQNKIKEKLDNILLEISNDLSEENIVIPGKYYIEENTEIAEDKSDIKQEIINEMREDIKKLIYEVIGEIHIDNKEENVTNEEYKSTNLSNDEHEGFEQFMKKEPEEKKKKKFSFFRK